MKIAFKTAVGQDTDMPVEMYVESALDRDYGEDELKIAKQSGEANAAAIARLVGILAGKGLLTVEEVVLIAGERFTDQRLVS